LPPSPSPPHSLQVILSSCVFLLAQPDSLLLPPTNTIFLAPSLLASVATLYCITAAKILPLMPAIVARAPHLYIAGRTVRVW